MSKRLRVEDDFNPVYPYGYARNQNIPFLTPPFVSSDGFQNFPPGVLSLKLADPIAIVNGNVSLKVGGGLTVEEQSGKLSVDTKAPLQVANDNKLELSYDDPFKVENNKLGIKAGHGLAVVTKENTSLPSLVGTLVVLTGKGIGTGTSAHGGTIDVRLGEGGGLSFDEKGDLVAWDKKNDTRTLWTTPDPSPNCKVETARDSKLTLALTKCGSQILATVSLLVVTGKYAIISDTVNPKQFSIKLLFNDKGVLLSDSNLDGTYWNYRSNNNNIGTPYKEAVGFMPSTTAYPKPTNNTSTDPDKKVSQGKNKIVSNIYLGGEVYQPGFIVVKFNQETDANCAYSITFDFGWGKVYKDPIPYDTSSFTFSYIAQE